MAEAEPEPDPNTDRDHDQKTTNTIGLLDRVKTLLEKFINDILDHPPHSPQYLGRASLIHMRHQCQELQELADLLLDQGNFGVLDLERVLLQQLKPQIEEHLRIIQVLEGLNVIPNRTIEIPLDLRRKLRMIAEIYKDIDEKLRQVRFRPLPSGHAGPHGPQPPRDQ